MALMLVLQGLVAPMRDGAPANVPGAVFIDDQGLIAAVTQLDPELSPTLPTPNLERPAAVNEPVLRFFIYRSG